MLHQLMCEAVFFSLLIHSHVFSSLDFSFHCVKWISVTRDNYTVAQIGFAIEALLDFT